MVVSWWLLASLHGSNRQWSRNRSVGPTRDQSHLMFKSARSRVSSPHCFSDQWRWLQSKMEQFHWFQYKSGYGMICETAHIFSKSNQHLWCRKVSLINQHCNALEALQNLSSKIGQKEVSTFYVLLSAEGYWSAFKVKRQRMACVWYYHLKLHELPLIILMMCCIWRNKI